MVQVNRPDLICYLECMGQLRGVEQTFITEIENHVEHFEIMFIVFHFLLHGLDRFVPCVWSVGA